MDLISTTHALAAVCERFARHPFVTVDTEFLRETTFWPKLCVAQMASTDEAVVVDALAEGIDLTPLFELMTNKQVTKVFHAARQDIEIMWNLAKLIPAPLFDTQVAAMVLGHGDSISYDQLVQRITGDHIDKSSRFTDWARRPLAPAQLTYAISDVTHLVQIYEKLNADLAARGRAEWVQEEMKILTSPATYRQLPEEAWHRLKNRARKPKELAVLMEITAWREREAQSRDVPRQRVLKDDAIAELARTQPKTAEALGSLRALPRGFERSKSGEAVLEAIAAGLARDPKTLPKIGHGRAANGDAATVELLKVLLRMTAEKNGVASRVIATVDELEAIAADDDADVPALKGWRRAMFGERALALKAGKLSLAVEKGRVVAVDR